MNIRPSIPTTCTGGQPLTCPFCGTYLSPAFMGIRSHFRSHIRKKAITEGEAKEGMQTMGLTFKVGSNLA